MHSKQTILTITLFFLLFHLFQATWTCAQLETIDRTDETTSLQLYFRFTELPEYELSSRKRRIDLFLKNISAVENIQLPDSDDRIIKVLSRQQEDGLLLSFFFRYPPQKVAENARQEPASLMLDILLGNPFTAMYPDLSTKFKGLTLLNRDAIDYTNPVHISPYPENWRSFFSNYESPVVITPATTFTLPPFPMAAVVDSQLPVERWLPKHILKSAQKKEWQLTAQQIFEHLEIEENILFRDFLLLSYTEALVRAGEYQKPHRLLQQISHRYKSTQLAGLADLLFVYLRNLNEADFFGFYELQKAIKKLGSIIPFNEYFSLLLAEAAMDLGNLEAAQKELNRDDIGFDKKAGGIRLMHKADLLFLRNKPIKALVHYLQLDEQKNILHDYPDSLARYCDLLYEFKRYRQTEKQYRHLNDLLDGKRQYDRVLYRLTMSRKHNQIPERQIISELYGIQEAFPKSEGAFRAIMKMTDMSYLSGKYQFEQSLNSYTKLSIEANTVPLREEAAFKKALLLLLNGQPEEAIQQCLKLLREFQSGALKIEARALIIQQLPGVIKNLVDKGNYIESIILAQQNRSLFAKGWISTSLLYDLANAYSYLGFFDRATRTYQYLFDISDGEQQEQIYLPLIQSLFQDGQFHLIEDYADRFSFRYPESKFLPDIYLLRIKALLRTGQTDKTIVLLDNTERPDSGEIKELAIKIYFEQERWKEVINKLIEHKGSNIDQYPPIQLRMLAESYFQHDQPEKAAPLFQTIITRQGLQDQALFRLAQIDIMRGDTDQALKRYQQIAEKGTSPLWKKLAQEEIAILQLQ